MGVWSELFRGAPTGSIISELSKGLNTISIRIGLYSFESEVRNSRNLE